MLSRTKIVSEDTLKEVKLTQVIQFIFYISWVSGYCEIVI